MPVYNWHCKKCDMVFEIFQSMTERDQDPPTHCPKCDPDIKEEEGTLHQIHVKGSLPKFRITDDASYGPSKLQ